MATSRTGTTKWLNLARRVRARDRRAGITNCPLCHKPIAWGNKAHPRSPEVDHIIPAHKNGTDSLENLRTVCRTCNRKRGGRDGATQRWGNRATPKLPPKTYPYSEIW